MTALLVALGGGMGAALRYVVATRLDRRVPWGTLAVNVLGSALIGVLVGAGAAGSAWAFGAVGFCGGFTTYSSFAVQTLERGPRLGPAYGIGTVVAVVAACALGFWLGSQA